jgi:hypothetical protein
MSKLIYARAEHASTVEQLLAVYHPANIIFANDPAEMEKIKQLIEDRSIALYTAASPPLKEEICNQVQWNGQWSEKLKNFCADSIEKLNEIVDYYLAAQSGQTGSSSINIERAAIRITNAIKTDPKNKLLKPIKEKVVDAMVARINKLADEGSHYYKDRACILARRHFGGTNKKIKMACNPTYAAEQKALEKAKLEQNKAPLQPSAPAELQPAAMTASPAYSPQTPAPTAPTTSPISQPAVAPKPKIAPGVPALPKGPGLKNKSDKFKSLFSLKTFFDLKEG